MAGETKTPGLATLTLTVRGVKAMLLDFVRNKITWSIFQRGKSGIGKSDGIRQVAAETTSVLIDERAIHYEPPDVNGYLMFNPAKQAGEFFPSHLETKIKEALKQAERVMVHIDEFNLAKPSTQNAFYGLILDHELRGQRLPDNVHIIASGNRTSDRANTYTLPMPLVRRFVLVDVEEHLLEWTQDFAIPRKINPFVIGFVHFRRNLFHRLPEADQEEQYPTPAGWERISKLLEFIDCGDKHDPRLKQYGASIVGSGPALEFAKYCEKKDMIDRLLGDVMSAKFKSIPDEPSLLYALNQFLIARFRDDPKKTVEHLLQYALHIPESFADVAGALCSSMTTLHKTVVASAHTFPEFAEKFGRFYLAE